MNSSPTLSIAPDSDLIARSLEGDRDAYADLVRRHQSVVCALTYAACGDVHQSEDLAQETFLTAWKNLRKLHDPSTLRAWLRGIARNLCRNAFRKTANAPAVALEDIATPVDASSRAPIDQAISREEQTILWQNLAKLPEDYREVMILYYRQGESTAAVAEAMEISEDNVRQRLSRGRAMLAQRIEGLIDRGLRDSAPGQGFATAVVAALPALAASKTAVALGVAAKGSATAKSATLGGLLTTILGPFIYIASAYLGYRIGLEQTIAPEERRYIRRFFGGILVIVAVFVVLLLAAIFGCRAMGASSETLAALLGGLSVVYFALLLTACIKYSKRIRTLRAEITARDPVLAARAKTNAQQWNMQYRSRWRPLGLPPIDIQIGSDPDLRPKTAKGWIAIGAKAYGLLFAAGAIAVAPISWGGFSAGILTYGGFALGIWSVGVFAIGFKSIGVVAIAWHASSGIVAFAYRYAQGISALAHHANNARANQVMKTETFFRAWDWFTTHANWVFVLSLLPLVIVGRRARKIRRENTLHDIASH